MISKHRTRQSHIPDKENMKTIPTSVHLFLAECTYAPKSCGFKPFVVYRVFLRSRKAACLGDKGKTQSRAPLRELFPPNGLPVVIVIGPNPGLPIAIFRIGIRFICNIYLDYSMVVKRKRQEDIREIDWKQ